MLKSSYERERWTTEGEDTAVDNVEGQLRERDGQLLERKQKLKNILTFQSTGMNPQRC